jgi:hypothetical protein
MLAFSYSILSHDSVAVDLFLDFVDACRVYCGLELVFPHVLIYLFLCLFEIAGD